MRLMQDAALSAAEQSVADAQFAADFHAD